MRGSARYQTSLKALCVSRKLVSLVLLCSTVLIVATVATPAHSRPRAPQQAKPTGANPIPEPAVPAILAAFEKYEVVGMMAAHSLKDLDDFILTLIRTPAFSERVNDIVVECGNSMYQPILDRYIAGEDVPFAEVRKVWRNTTQPMCGKSGFYEQFFPLVRAINQKVPPAHRLRVLAGDPPIDWDQIKKPEGGKPLDRDASIVAVMEKEVLSKHRKALMLFGTFHLMHGVGAESAMSIYEKNYPNLTFVISDLQSFDTGPFATWPVPSLAVAKGTWLGALGLGRFIPPYLTVDKDCNLQGDYSSEYQKPVSDLVDALLYLGPRDLMLKEPVPGDIVLDADYMTEYARRANLIGFRGPMGGDLNEFYQQIVKGAENSLYVLPTPLDPKPMVEHCMEQKKQRQRP